MIYLDNAATTLHKPPEVAEAVKNAILTAGNASRGAHGVSLSASRMVFETRSQLASCSAVRVRTMLCSPQTPPRR